jgi:hypothetical protein
MQGWDCFKAISRDGGKTWEGGLMIDPRDNVAYPDCGIGADGFLYIGYGGDYNLQYTDSFVAGGGSVWGVSYVTGSTWMENYNCISTATWKGNKYAAFVMGCHFNYDMADAVLLDINNPAAAQHLYTHYGDADASWDWEAGVNNSWTGLGTYSDVLLVPAEDALYMAYVDSNYGTIGCVQIK